MLFATRCGERDFIENVVRKVISTKDVNHKGQGLWVNMRKLPGDVQQVIAIQQQLQSSLAKSIFLELILPT